jgi:hypothetical protein
MTVAERLELVEKYVEPMLKRELEHRGVVQDGMGFTAELVGWVEVDPHQVRS